MKKNILLALPFLALMLLSSCAASFTSLNPKSFYYSNTTITDSVKLSYKYNVLTERGNKKYAKKELKMGVKITAIKIVNNGNETLKYGENFKFVSGDKDVIPLDPLTTFQKVKQKTTSHLWYLLMLPLQLNIVTPTSKDSYPIGLVVGPGLAIGNLLYASSSNSKFKEELLQYDVLGKDIKPGETGTFLLSFQNVEFGPLGIKMMK
jgi:hypothetical protein